MMITLLILMMITLLTLKKESYHVVQPALIKNIDNLKLLDCFWDLRLSIYFVRTGWTT